MHEIVLLQGCSCMLLSHTLKWYVLRMLFRNILQEQAETGPTSCLVQ